MTLGLVGFGRKTGAISSKVTWGVALFLVILHPENNKNAKDMKQNIPFRAVLATMMLTLSAVVMAQTNDDDVEVVYATDSLAKDSVTWSKELDGVEIVHQKRLVKMDVDKMTYQVSEDEDAKSYTVLDMLRKVLTRVCTMQFL